MKVKTETPPTSGSGKDGRFDPLPATPAWSEVLDEHGQAAYAEFIRLHASLDAHAVAAYRHGSYARARIQQVT